MSLKQSEQTVPAGRETRRIIARAREWGNDAHGRQIVKSVLPPDARDLGCGFADGLTTAGACTVRVLQKHTAATLKF
jgi:hypothetical protein